MFGWTAALVHGSTVLIALILVVIHWGELTSNVTDRVFSLENLLLIGLIYPFVKVIHEFGHAYTVKRWGGEVHEMGVMFLVFVPIPYLDASSASAFREKYKRVVVGAAGLFVETFIAALAVFVWVSVEPGAVRAVAFNILLIAGVSTLLFNGNPLLRYDAYYILSDVLEIPNLGTRANSYIGYLIQNYVFGINEIHSPANTRGEAIWLAIYSIASSIYRFFIVVAICLVAAKRFFALGVLIAIWAAFGLLVVPFVFTARFLITNVYIRRRRTRVIIVCAVTACLVIFCTLVMPMPLFTIAEGVVWAPEQSEVRTEVDGFVDEVLAVPGQTVRQGASLIRIENPELTAHARLLEAQLREYQARKLAAMSSDRTEMKIVQDEIDRIQAELDEIREQLANLVIRSRTNGTFLLPRAEDLPENFVKRGTQLGYVVDFSNITVRVVVPQSVVSRVRTNTRKVEARLSGTVSEIIPSKVIREVPEASSDLPSLALSLEGGGAIALDPTKLKEPQAFQRFFQFDIMLSQVPLSRIGERVLVRFIHNPEPLAYRWYRSIRRL
ncbi:efflux RND transporter periplasmic adaptor subunit, partial [Candidatus Latescibacterota bacterium]